MYERLKLRLIGLRISLKFLYNIIFGVGQWHFISQNSLQFI